MENELALLTLSELREALNLADLNYRSLTHSAQQEIGARISAIQTEIFRRAHPDAPG